jgi:arylsulfatase A-like enzyme
MKALLICKGPLVVLAALLAAALSPSTSSATAAEERGGRPNILFIYTDDQSHRTVSCYPEAYDWVRTPNIDGLAARGVRFTHAYIGTWCMPSRATLLTGLHPYGIESMRMEGKYPGSVYDPNQCRFWPRVFRQQGYVTAQIGKWHTGTDTGFGRDWDYQVVWNRPAHPDNAPHYYDDQLLTFNGSETRLVKGYTTDNYTNWAVDFIGGKHRDPDKPWYLWLCYGAVHGPYTPAARHQNAYAQSRVPIPVDIYPPRPGKPAYMQQVEFWVRNQQGRPVRNVERPALEERKSLNEWVRQYHQGVLAIDEGVGKLLAALEASGQLEQTLVVFTSDQGFAWGQHGFCTKLAPYDANLRAPFVASMPGTLPAGVVCETPIGGADLVPTFFHFAGIDLPWAMHGNDLTELFKAPGVDWPHPVLLAMTGASYGSDTDTVPTDPKLIRAGIPWWVSFRQGRYKYIRTLVEGEMEELYEVHEDPEELHNLALEETHATRLTEFRTATVAELRRTGAKMADELPSVQGASP